MRNKIKERIKLCHKIDDLFKIRTNTNHEKIIHYHNSGLDSSCH